MDGNGEEGTREREPPFVSMSAIGGGAHYYYLNNSKGGGPQFYYLNKNREGEPPYYYLNNESPFDYLNHQMEVQFGKPLFRMDGNGKEWTR